MATGVYRMFSSLLATGLDQCSVRIATSSLLDCAQLPAKVFDVARTTEHCSFSLRSLATHINMIMYLRKL